MPIKRFGTLVLLLLLVVGGGLAIGFVTAPGDWYANLAKPSFNPPNWVFGPVWTCLYVVIAVVGWRAIQRGGPLPWLWWAQLVLNFAWSPIFFAAHQIGAALAVIVLLLLTILAFVLVSLRQDRVSAVLFLPYLAWVSFASLLNWKIWILN